MPSASCEFKIQLDEDLAVRVWTAAEGIGMSTSTAVRAPLQPDYSKIPQANVVDGVLVMPASWNDGDDGDDE